jgi:fumarate hydratase class II
MWPGATRGQMHQNICHQYTRPLRVQDSVRSGYSGVLSDIPTPGGTRYHDPLTWQVGHYSTPDTWTNMKDEGGHGREAMHDFRLERDSMGDVHVPSQAYYSAQTQRAVENFPISGWSLPDSLIHAMGLVKFACATANRDLGKLTGEGKLDDPSIEALLAACREVADGKMDDQFPVDVFQTGSGTSSNMNVNEVISNLAIEKLGGDRFDSEKPIHPNDHVNMGQSTNDTFPTAIHVAAAGDIKTRLIPALTRLSEVLEQKSAEWDQVIKIGRTHLMDATPLRLGQEIGAFGRQVRLSVTRAQNAIESLKELAVGGTAVGSGINTHREFGRRVSETLASETGIEFVEAEDHFEANSQRDALVQCSGLIKTIAVTLFNVSNNIRFLSSGPRCGYSELQLPTRQPGSSIMPGKVNPVMCESMMQVAARVMGNDQTVSVAGAAGGQFQLNIMMPVMAHAILESIQLLASVTGAFVDFCAEGMEANIAMCEASVEQSLSMVTSLNPLIGYEKAAKLAKEAFDSGKTIRQLCREQGILPDSTLNQALDPLRMTEPNE